FRTVLDIGANVGEFAVAARHVMPGARVIAFEPLPECFAELKQRLGNDPHCTLMELALGNETGEATFRRCGCHPASSLLELAERQVQAFPHLQGETETKVRMARLDDIAPGLNIVEPLLVKIDVQGFESAVIDGGEATMRRAAVIILETSFEPL